MTGEFIYVFSLESCQQLQDMGYTLWQENKEMYIFINDKKGDLSGVEHIVTNRMTF